MYTVLVLSGPELDAGGWIPRLLALDRANMGGVLAAAGFAFPEERRRAGLASGDATAVLLLRGEDLAGYGDFTRDRRDPADLYVASLQLAPAYRGTAAFGVLLGAMLQVARRLPFRRLTSNVQANNARMLALAQRLGFALTPLADRQSVEVVADRAWLDSPAVRRLARRRLCGTAAFPPPPAG